MAIWKDKNIWFNILKYVAIKIILKIKKLSILKNKFNWKSYRNLSKNKADEIIQKTKMIFNDWKLLIIFFLINKLYFFNLEISGNNV